MFTDNDLAATSDRDQREATIKDMARDIGLFHKELRKNGVPRDVAKSITGAFAAMVVFPSCGCGVE